MMIDFKDRLTLLKRINSVRISGQPISHMQIYGSYNVWQCFQNKIFYEDLRTLDVIVASPRLLVFLLRICAMAVNRATLLWIRMRQPSVLIYSMDKLNSSFSYSDVRMDSIYRPVINSRVCFIEVFHTILGRSFLKHLWNRNRLAIYDAGIITNGKSSPIDWSTVDLSDFSPEEQPKVRHVLQKYLSAVPRFSARVEFYRKMLQDSSIRLILAIDDTRSYGELMLAARLCNIPAYAFQHGHYTKYHLGWLSDREFRGEIIRPSALYVWSDYWRAELLRLGTYFKPEELMVGGLLESPPYVNRPNNQTITIAIPYEIDADKSAVKRYVQAFLQCGFRVLFKLRSDIDETKQLEEYALVAHPQLSATRDQHVVLAQADVVAGTYSTYLYDMLVQGRPIVLLATASDFGGGMVRNSLAQEVSFEHSPCDTLRIAALMPEEELAKRRTKLLGHSPRRMEDAVRSLL